MLINIDLEKFLDGFLKSAQFKDYCPNGLQVEGCSNIKKIVTGVTASQALLDKAVELNADAVLVHHGYFWKGESQVITNIKYKRINTLIKNDINLFAYHLPLDCHPVIGNNVQLANRLGIKLSNGLDLNDKNSVAMAGELENELNLKELSKRIELSLDRIPLVISGGNHKITKVGICTGGGQDYIELAASQGMHAFISGEVSERTTHLAKELGIHYISAGHHATERYGVLALGELLANKYGIDVEFVDINNPV